MAVTLYPGIKRLHLFYTTRYDTIRTSDVRDDLLGVKVWISTQQGFNPQTTTPIDFGVGSTISIDNLLSNTQYYIRYAFISKIDPAVYTISSELNARTYDELTSVYGELTNSPHYLARSANSNTPDWQYATGTFRVWNISQEVTGNGPVYSIVPNSATNGLQATINSTTGVFTATNWSGTANSAKVTFKAVYNGTEVLRDWIVVSGIGQDAPQIRLSLTPDNFVYRDGTAILAETPQVVATANLTNLSGNPVFTVRAFRSNGTEITSPTIQFTQTNNVITISRNQFHISNDIAYATIRAEIGTVYDEDTIFRLNNGTDTITVDLKNPVVQLQAAANGSVDPAEYLDTGTTIEVYEGAEKLLVDNSSPYANGTWTITNIVGTGIVPEDQPSYGTYAISFPQHANMTEDTATIEYTIQYKTKAGFVATRVVSQKFSKSKQGNAGDDAISVDLASESDVVAAENDGTGYALPTGNALRLYKGAQQLTTGVTYSGTATKNGLALAINNTTGAITLSGTSWSTDQESFTVSASYNGIAYSAIYTIAKSKKGSDAVAIDLISEADVVSAASDGTGYTLPTGNALRLYKGGILLTSGVNYSGTATQNGLTLNINSSGSIALSGTNWTSNQENFTLTASSAGVNYTAIYSIAKSRQGAKGDPGANGAAAKTVDITGITNFTVNTGDAIIPANATLTAVTQNITSPNYNWTVTNANPSSGTGSSITITPSSASVTSITVALTVTEPSTGQTFSRTVTMSVAQRGVPGQGGSNGLMSAFPSAYLWTGSSSAPGTGGLNSTEYTWSTGSYTAPSGWSKEPPTNTSPGQYLWEITFPLTVSAITSTSTLVWSGLTPRAVAYNGINGSNGAPGAPGAPGDPGAPGAAGSATFLVTRAANDSSAPTNLEVVAAIGRNPIAGDIATVSFNNRNGSITYRYTTSWIQQVAYITGSLIVQNSISGDRITARTLSVESIQSTSSATFNGGTFGLGVGTTARGYGTIGSFIANNGNFGLIAGDEFTGASGAGAIAGVALGTQNWGGQFHNFSGSAGGFYDGNLMRTTAALATGNIAAIIKLNRLGTSPSGLAATPVSQANLGNEVCAGAFAKWTATGSGTLLSDVQISSDVNAIKVWLGVSDLLATTISTLGVGTANFGGFGEIRATGNITAYFSDDRLKTRIGLIPDALNKVNQLSGFYYRANETAEKLGYSSEHIEVGVSAQAVKEVLPEIVTSAPVSDEYLTVRYERLTPLLIEAIKELHAKVKYLEDLIDANPNRTDRSQ